MFFRRQRIVDNVYPNASHQLIIFSTNGEIDEKFYSRLKPHIGRSYLVDFDRNKRASSIHPGYFWDNIEVKK